MEPRGVEVRLIARRGKGSHRTLYYGVARAVVQDVKKELPTGTLHAMLEPLGLTNALHDARHQAENYRLLLASTARQSELFS